MYLSTKNFGSSFSFSFTPVKYTVLKQCCRFIGPYRNYRYGGKGNNFYNESLKALDVDINTILQRRKKQVCK